MPLILRHLAAVLLPLASTTTGIVAVSVALQMPAGPPERAAVPPTVVPVGAVAPVVVRAVPGKAPARKRPARSPVGSSIPERAPSLIRSRTSTPRTTPPPVAVASSLPVSTARKPLPPDDAAPLTPPVVPPPQEPPEPVSTPGPTAPVAPSVAIGDSEPVEQTGSRNPNGRAKPRKDKAKPKKVKKEHASKRTSVFALSARPTASKAEDADPARGAEEQVGHGKSEIQAGKEKKGKKEEVGRSGDDSKDGAPAVPAPPQDVGTETAAQGDGTGEPGAADEARRGKDERKGKAAGKHDE